MDKDPQTAWRIIDELKKDYVAVETAEGINRQDWHDHFQKLLNTEANKVTENRKNFIKEELRYFEDLKHVSSIDYSITEKEISIACQKLNKASAYDTIRNELIKSVFPFISKLLVNLFNDNGQFPDIWTEGIIIPVHKQGSRLDNNNYRGITLSSCLGKLFCHVVNDRIVKMLDSKKFIKPEQTGFRKNCPTADHIFVVKTLLINMYRIVKMVVNYMHVTLT